MDVLSEVLSWIRVEGTLSRRSEFSAPWGIAYPAHPHASLLVVESGGCFLMDVDATPRRLEAGDLLMFLPGNGKCIADAPETPVVPYAKVLETHAAVPTDRYAPDHEAFPTLRYGGGGAVTAIRGWGLQFEGRARHPVLSLMPPIIHLTYASRAALPWLETTLRFLLHETHHQRDGSDMMSVRLVDLLFLQVIRAWFESQPTEQSGWIGALRDPDIGQALRLIHRYPADDWTVGTLAKAVGRSRSSFSARFQAMVGTPPLTYLTSVRMNLAAVALDNDPHANLAAIASDVGYDNPSSFGRVFKRHFGVSPGAFRRASDRSE